MDVLDKKAICELFEIPDFSGTVIYAVHEAQSYEGSAAVVFADEGKLHMVTSSHCSCNGFEGTWDPDEVTIDMLRKLAETSYGEAKGVAQEVIAMTEKFGTSDADALAAAIQMLGVK